MRHTALSLHSHQTEGRGGGGSLAPQPHPSDGWEQPPTQSAYGQRWSLTPSSDGHAAPHWDGCDNQHVDPSPHHHSHPGSHHGLPEGSCIPSLSLGWLGAATNTYTQLAIHHRERIKTLLVTSPEFSFMPMSASFHLVRRPVSSLSQSASDLGIGFSWLILTIKMLLSVTVF